MNPNTNTETTAMLLRRFTAASGPGVGVSAVTALHGPPMITTPDALADAARHVVDAVLDALDVGRPDAVVIGAFGDPGVAELRGHARLSGIPVTGIGEASLLDATSDGRRFAIATT
ncbi:MAG: aspartate/glutamate racemase family protein, partial [Mycobacteriaceae bacterium]